MLKKILLIILILFLQVHSLFPQEIDALKNFKYILSLPEDKIDVIDVLIAELTIDKIIDPSINVEAYPKKIDEIIKGIKKVAENKDVSCKDINTFLFEKGSWNNYQVYTYQTDDPLGKNIKTRLLSNYLDTKKGNCNSMPLLYFIIARDLDLVLDLAKAPRHLYIQAKDNKGVTWNIEPTNKGLVYSEAYYIDHFKIPTKSIENKIYLTPLTNKEIIADILSKLVLFYINKKEYKKALYICDLIIKNYPKHVSAMVNKGAIYTLIRNDAIDTAADQHLSKFDSLKDYFDWLDAQAKKYQKTAENLGWTERSEEDEKRYLQEVKEKKEQLAKEESKLW